MRGFSRLTGLPIRAMFRLAAGDKSMPFHRSAKQDWTIGQVVKIGFVSGLEIVKKVATPGNYLPDQYVLRQKTTGRIYCFVPHNGLSRCASIEEASAW